MKDYLLLLDGNEKLKRIINAYEFYDDEIKSTTTGERVLTFKMNDSVVDIENGNKIGVFIEGKFDLFIVDQVEAETYYSTSIKVTCLHDFYSIQTQKAITQYYKESVSVHDAMTEMLKGTSYELGECVERTLISIGPYLFKNPLWCIQDIISNFGVEINYSIELNETRTGIARKLVHVVNALGSDTGIRCSTDLNVSKIKRIEKDKFYTVMYGCGAEYQKDLVKYKYDFKDISWSASNGSPTDKPAGQEFVEDKKAMAKYGRIIGIFEDGRIKDPELLLKKTWEALQKNNRPIVSYELDIEELKTEDGYEHLNFKLGDIIILQNTIDNSRAKFRIVEDCVSVRNKNKRKVTVGEQIKGIFSGGNSGNSDGTEGPGGSVIDPGGEEIKPPSLEEITPDTLPAVPIVTAKGLWGKVMLSWTYENKMYYNYEVYASRIKDFEPIVFNMIYSGKASAFLHEAGANETWYYRVRAVNTFGNSTEFSQQVEATTTKLADGTEYFESAAIKDALIEELRLDRGWIGQLDATYLKVKGKFTVVDGNNTETMKVDSFGHITLKPSVFKMLVDGKEEDIVTYSRFEVTKDEILFQVGNSSQPNIVANGTPTASNTAGWYTDNGGWFYTAGLHPDHYVGLATTESHEGYSYTEFYPVKPNTTYTVYAKVLAENNTKGADVFALGSQSTAGEFAQVIEFLNVAPGDQKSGYRVFRTNGDINYLRLRVDNNGYNGAQPAGGFVVWMEEFMILEGAFNNPNYRPSSNQILNNVLRVNNEGMEIEHNNNSKAKFTHEAIDFLNSQGRRTLRIKDGGFNFHTWQDPAELVGFIKSSVMPSLNNYNGVTLSTYGHGDYIAIGTSTSQDENSWLNNPNIFIASHGGMGNVTKAGTWFLNEQVYSRTAINAYSGITLNPDAQFPHRIYNSTENKLCVFGDNSTVLGIKYGNENRTALEVTEDEGQVSKTYIHAWGDWDFHNYTIRNVKVSGFLEAQSSMLRSFLKAMPSQVNDTYSVMSTTDGELRYTQRRAEHITNKTLIVELPHVFSENIELDYHVNISKLSWGDYRIIEKTQYYFEIETNVDDFSFTYEVVAKLIEKPDSNISIARSQYMVQDIDEVSDESDEIKSIIEI